MQGKTIELELDRGWLIAIDDNNCGKEEGWMNAVRPDAVSALVPGFISDSIDTFSRGVAWYWNSFDMGTAPEADYEYYLKAGYTEWIAEYWLNGQYLGSFVGTRLNYEFNMTGILREKNNLLAIRIVSPTSDGIDGYQFGGEILEFKDNIPVFKPNNIVTCARNLNSHYGGIRYPVRISTRPRLRTEKTRIRSDRKDGSFSISAKLLNHTGAVADAEINVTIQDKDGEAVWSHVQELSCSNKETDLCFDGSLGQYHLWDVESPYLYSVLITVSSSGHIIHTGTTRFGFREFCVQDGFFFLNGRRIFLKCAHTQLGGPSWKNNPWDKQFIRDELVRVKAMGHNATRYLCDSVWPEILDFCDEIGLMIYEEHAASWDMHPDNPFFKEQFMFHASEVLKRDFNHPSFALFGLVNESHSQLERECAKQALKPLRDIDDTRLFLLGSGRWDGEWSVGSVSNPGSPEWECVWGAERPDAPKEPDLYQCMFGREDLTQYGGMWGEREDCLTCWTPEQGDTHIYPRSPMTPRAIDIIRTHSKNQKPAFLSEGGHTSMGNPMRIVRKAEEGGFGDNKSYAWMERVRDKRFCEDFKRYGMDELFGVPEDVPRASYPLNAKLRSAFYDCVRSNPQFCGFSYTYMIESGDGAGMIMWERDQYKPYMCDTVSDAFAPLHWCVFVNPTSVYAGEPFTVEAVLASEDVLGPGEYPVTAKIVSKEYGKAWEYHTTLTIPEKPDNGLLPFAFPVFKETVTISMPEGKYDLTVYLEHGGWPTGGRKTITLSKRRSLCQKHAAMIGLADGFKQWLNKNGVDEDEDSRLLLIGTMPDDDASWEELYKKIEDGASAVFLLPETLLKGVDEPFNGEKEYVPERLPFENKGKLTYEDNWHYHTFGAVKAHPYTKDLEKGLMDDEYYMLSIPEFAFFEQDVPDEIAAVSIGLPYYTHSGEGTTGYLFGTALGVYNYGKGRLILNCFKLFDQYGDSPSHDNLGHNPAADRVLFNIIEHESEILGKHA